MTVPADLQEQKGNFDLMGFAHLKRVFSEERIAAMTAQLDRFLEGDFSRMNENALNTNDQGDVVQIKGLNRQSAEFDELLNDSALTTMASTLLGQEVVPNWVHYRNAPCQTDDEVYPHQDAQGLNLHPCHAVTFWMPLGSCGPDSGCLRYVPGSHWGGFQALEYAPWTVDRVRDREVELTVDAGDILAHHCMTIHRSAPNRTPQRRPALMFFYKAAAAESIEPAAWLERYGQRASASTQAS
jgi:ectoine hydroxylase-related dioxygenase (phytanoyl-CoA dioxygenase family)